MQIWVPFRKLVSWVLSMYGTQLGYAGTSNGDKEKKGKLTSLVLMQLCLGIENVEVLSVTTFQIP